jgi:hypothetical protein
MASLLLVMLLVPVAAAQGDSEGRTQDDSVSRDSSERRMAARRDNEEDRGRPQMRDERNRPFGIDVAQRDLPRENIDASGRIAMLKEVQLRGSDNKHVVALVQTGRNRRGIVDLGPAEDLADLRLRQGDRISVSGQVLGMGDRRVLMADELEKDGQTTQIDRSVTSRSQTRRAVRQSDLRDRLGSQFTSSDSEERQRMARRSSDGQSQSRSQRSEQRRTATVRGSIERTKTVSLRNTDQKNLVALVRLESDNERVRLVDLGAINDRISPDQLQKGDQIVAQGVPARIGDRPVLLAQRVRIDGNERRVDRNWPTRQQDDQGANTNRRSSR